MPRLCDVLKVFGHPIRTTDGRIIQGMIEPPKLVLRQYDATFLPRAILKTAPNEVVPSTVVIINRDGQRYLVMPLADDTFIRAPVKNTYVLFQVTHDAMWTRPGSPGTEMISGLPTPGTDQALGTIPVVIEYVPSKVDSVGVMTAQYKALSNAAIQLGDSLDQRRVRAVSVNAGISYADLV